MIEHWNHQLTKVQILAIEIGLNSGWTTKLKMKMAVWFSPARMIKDASLFWGSPHQPPQKRCHKCTKDSLKISKPIIQRSSKPKPKSLTGWWYTYPSEKYEFVSWAYSSQYDGKVIKFHGSKPPSSLGQKYVPILVPQKRCRKVWWNQDGTSICPGLWRPSGITGLFGADAISQFSNCSVRTSVLSILGASTGIRKAGWWLDDGTGLL